MNTPPSEIRHNFRADARRALARADIELGSGMDERLRYAALELRMCIEALTYDRAQLFEDDLPLTEWAAWQPKTVMETVIAIEPKADIGSTVNFREESRAGEEQKPWQHVGVEKVFSLKQIKASYDALGSYLHYPTLRQLRSKPVDLSKLRRRCEKLRDELAQALASTVYNVKIRGHSTIMACRNCGSRIRTFYRIGDPETEVRCIHPTCGEIYDVTTADGEVVFGRRGTRVRCKSPNCEHEHFLPSAQTVHGHSWTCASCEAVYVVHLGVIGPSVLSH